MTFVMATCQTCGDVKVSIEKAQIQICTTNGRSTYAFVCPKCKLIIIGPANAREVHDLVGAGVDVALWSFPVEVGEQKRGQKIEYDDVLVFCRKLASDEVVSKGLEDIQ